jgi:hypothetical protein
MELQQKPRSNLFLERFKKGLMNWYGFTLEELTENYKYCGGDGGNKEKSSHYNYWVLQFGDKDFPYKEFECICGHDIVENCFMVDKTRKKFIHMGNCCIKRFMPENKSSRTCELCEEPHKNRKDNLCYDCRETYNRCVICKEYFEFDDKKHEYCDECYDKKREIERQQIQREREQRQREREERQREIEENYKKNMNAKKGLMNANQTATKIKQIKQCSECNINYETYNTIEEECLCNECKQTKQIQIEEENKKIREENVKKQQRIGLMCECELRTILREVKKDGVNKGKLFYCCPQHYDDKCDYFMWKDESDRRINRNVKSIESIEEKELIEEREENINKNNEQECKLQQKNGIICYCKFASVLREVKKDGPNKGRLFYTCSNYTDKCKYFVWKDEIKK